MMASIALWVLAIFTTSCVGFGDPVVVAVVFVVVVVVVLGGGGVVGAPLAAVIERTLTSSAMPAFSNAFATSCFISAVLSIFVARFDASTSFGTRISKCILTVKGDVPFSRLDEGISTS